ncbi:hypothetical protein PQY92_02415 [Candidatus Pelagibacter sp.]|nr:hypothetical protein [Candidatus Pelagibacter sp.]
MKRLLLILILTLSFQTFSKADDIRDFEIEGISIGDNLLNFINEKEILNNKMNYQYKNDKYFSISIKDSKYLKTYDFIEIYLKKNDKKYVIYSIDAANFFDDKKKCLSKMDEIKDEISGLFVSKIIQNKKKITHASDPSGKSIYYRTSWKIKNRDFIAIECVFWSQDFKEKNNFGDHLRISVTKKEIDDWLMNEAY